MQDRSVTVRTGAKVNPWLVLHGRRADGYHELTTLLLGLALFDDVTVRFSPGSDATRVATAGAFATPDIPADESNLAARGADAVAAVLGLDVAFDIDVTKSIPTRAGLGGGSADAAAAALGALALCAPGEVSEGAGAGPAIERQVTEALGRIGADCAFFFAARSEGAALAKGRGETVVPIQAHAPRDVVLLTPDIDCATPAVYGALGLDPSTEEELHARSQSPDQSAAAEWLSAPLAAARQGMRNDLEPAAHAAFPGLAPWRELLDGLGYGHFRLAGSGSSFFGLFDPAEPLLGPLSQPASDGGEASVALARIREAASAAGLGLRFSGRVSSTGPGPLLRVIHSEDPR